MLLKEVKKTTFDTSDHTRIQGEMEKEGKRGWGEEEMWRRQKKKGGGGGGGDVEEEKKGRGCNINTIL